MAIEVVPNGDERCGKCGAAPDGHYVCESCFKDLQLKFGLDAELTYGTDREGRRWINRIPDDPRQN